MVFDPLLTDSVTATDSHDCTMCLSLSSLFSLFPLSSACLHSHSMTCVTPICVAMLPLAGFAHSQHSLVQDETGMLTYMHVLIVLIVLPTLSSRLCPVALHKAQNPFLLW